MKKIVIVSACLIFAGIIICGSSFAQRDVNVAQEAAKKAEASLAQPSENEGAEEVEWGNPVNTNEPASNDLSIGEDGSIRIGYKGSQQKKQP